MADKEGTPKCQAAVIVCLTPDVCISPDKPAPYQIVAYFSDALEVSSNVYYNGFAATTLATRIARVTGNEPGTGGGVESGVNCGVCKPTDKAATTIYVNGECALRHDTEFEMNCDGLEGVGNTKGKAVFNSGGPCASIDADGNVVGDTDPQPEDATKRGFWGHLFDYYKGVWTPIWETAEFAGKAAQFPQKLIVGAANDAVAWVAGTQPAAWLPSAVGEVRSIGVIAQAITDNPALIWDGIKEPYVKAWAEGRYGEIAGRGVGEVAMFLVPLVGPASKLLRVGGLFAKVEHVADVFKVLRRLEFVQHGEFLRGIDELLSVARTHGKVDTFIKGAREADVLDGVLRSGRLTKAEIDDMVKAGVLTAEEAEIAQAAARGGDGIFVSQDEVAKFEREAARLIGEAREKFVADQIGGKRINRKIYGPNGKERGDIDVLGKNGEHVAVGGPSKSSNLDKWSEELKMYQEVAGDNKVVAALVYTTAEQRELIRPAVEAAQTILGKENVLEILMRP